MGTEIERKFLVSGPLPSGESTEITQAFLSVDPDRTVRVRIEGDAATLTIKARGEGITRAEFEYPIPVVDARQLFESALGEPIEKTRHRIAAGAHTWEIDLFHGTNDGLVVAEIELSSEDEAFERPAWLGDEVTSDPKYTNSSLAQCPYADWGDLA